MTDSLDARRRRTEETRSRRCAHCRLAIDDCICSRLERVSFPTELILIQHWRERSSHSNTGNLAAKVVENAKIVVYGARGEELDVAPLERADTRYLLLFPAGGSMLGPEQLDENRERTAVIVLDATWRQARRMFRRLGVLRSARPCSLPSGVRARSFLRISSEADHLNTCEAVACAAECLGAPTVATALYDALDLVVPRILAARGRRGDTRSRIRNRMRGSEHGQAILADED